MTSCVSCPAGSHATGQVESLNRFQRSEVATVALRLAGSRLTKPVLGMAKKSIITTNYGYGAPGARGDRARLVLLRSVASS